MEERKWSKCSFCGRDSEVRPHPPLGNEDYKNWKIWPMRLCFFCASIQEQIREMIEEIKVPNGN
jgi:hypothetical protein